MGVGVSDIYYSEELIDLEKTTFPLNAGPRLSPEGSPLLFIDCGTSGPRAILIDPFGPEDQIKELVKIKFQENENYKNLATEGCLSINRLAGYLEQCSKQARQFIKDRGFEVVASNSIAIGTSSFRSSGVAQDIVALIAERMPECYFEVLPVTGEAYYTCLSVIMELKDEDVRSGDLLLLEYGHGSIQCGYQSAGRLDLIGADGIGIKRLIEEYFRIYPDDLGLRSENFDQFIAQHTETLKAFITDGVSSNPLVALRGSTILKLATQLGSGACGKLLLGDELDAYIRDYLIDSEVAQDLKLVACARVLRFLFEREDRQEQSAVVAKSNFRIPIAIKYARLGLSNEDLGYQRFSFWPQNLEQPHKVVNYVNYRTARVEVDYIDSWP